jgi:hypothetical protein
MRALAGVIFGTGIIFSGEPTWAQTYDPKYPVCMEVNTGDDNHIECWFTSMEQCKNGSAGTGRCFENPYYKPPRGRSSIGDGRLSGLARRPGLAR